MFWRGAPPKNFEKKVKTPLDLIDFHFKKIHTSSFSFFYYIPFLLQRRLRLVVFTISFILRNIPKMLMNLKNFNYRNSCVVMG